MIDITKIKNDKYFKKNILFKMMEFLIKVREHSTFRTNINASLQKHLNITLPIEEYIEFLEIKDFDYDKMDNYDFELDKYNIYRLHVLLMNILNTNDDDFNDTIESSNWYPYVKILKPLKNDDLITKFLYNTNYKIDWYFGEHLQQIYFLTSKTQKLIIDNLFFENESDDIDYKLEMKQFFDPNIKSDLSKKIMIIRHIAPYWDKYYRLVFKKFKNNNGDVTYELWNKLGHILNDGELSFRHYKNNDNQREPEFKIDYVNKTMNLFMAALCLINGDHF